MTIALSLSGIRGTAADAGQVMQAVYSPEPVPLDASLQAPVWSRAKAYPLLLLSGADSPEPLEGGKVQFAWDDGHFYAAFTLEDRDIVQDSDRDQELHYQTGDVVELFLKPAGGSWYWEYYATPNGKKTALFFPARGGRGLQATLAATKSRIQVAATVDGSIHHRKDTDKGWTALMAIPLSEFAEKRISLDDKTPWRIFVARYNYGRHLPGRELTMHPPLTRLDFHLHEQWGYLELAGNTPGETSD